MALNPPVPGLRTIRYDAVSVAKVSLVVQPGDELTVSDYVADQLQRQSPQFKDGSAPPPATPDAVPEPVEAAEPVEPVKVTKRTRKG